MIVTVKVVPKARHERVERLLDGSLKVWVNAIPEHGKANTRLIKLLSEYFRQPKSAFRIARGVSSGIKQVEIQAED